MKKYQRIFVLGIVAGLASIAIAIADNSGKESAPSAKMNCVMGNQVVPCTTSGGCWVSLDSCCQPTGISCGAAPGGVSPCPCTPAKSCGE